ncbi:hypothetical protein COCNU_scaffold006975G000010 [Cocos nucifera]|nr:hypothetical protein [Cocos nucifera]
MAMAKDRDGCTSYRDAYQRVLHQEEERKGANDGSKRVKVGVSSSEVPTSTTIVFEVITDIETALTVEVGTAGMGLVPSMPSGPTDGDQVSKLPIKKGIREERKKKAIAKMSYKAYLDGPNGDDNE